MDTPTPPQSRRPVVRAFRVAFWNVLVLLALAGVLAAVGEAWLRLTWPFARPYHDMEIGAADAYIHKPGSELRWSNHMDYWTVDTANSRGFLDREPPSLERAAASCHVAVVGDSFIEAREVRLADKVQVRLEHMAAQRQPAWSVTTTAWGFRDTGQLAQLSYWDHYVRPLRPKLVVLVFVFNDFGNNTRYRNQTEQPHEFTLTRAGGWVARDGRRRRPVLMSAWQRLPTWARPYTAYWFRARQTIWRQRRTTPYSTPRPGEVTAESMDLTAHALDQWKVRTQEAGTALVILASHTMRWNPESELLFGTAAGMASAKGIPLVDQTEYIRRRGERWEEAMWRYDGHWTPKGHQWAAEALLEWMEANPSVCRRTDP